MHITLRIELFGYYASGGVFPRVRLSMLFAYRSPTTSAERIVALSSLSSGSLS